MKKLFFTALLLITVCAGATAQRYALIDMEYIMTQIPAYERANAQIEALGKQRQAEVEAQAKAAKALYQEYQQSASKLTETQRNAKETAIVEKEKQVAELRNKYFGPEGELQKKRQELIDPLQDKVYEAVKLIATQRGYDLVIDRASAQSLIFASPRIDISNEVLQVLGYSK